MQLKRLSIAGYRSFSPDAPFVLEDLGRVNVLLGPNGVGKSNVGRFAAWLGQVVRRTRGNPHYASPSILTPPYEPVDSWYRRGGPIEATLGVDARQLATLQCPASWLHADSTLDIAFTAQSQGGIWTGSLAPRAASGEPFFHFKQGADGFPEVLGPDLRYQPGGGNEQGSIQFFAAGLCELLTTRWLHVPALRHPEAAGSLGTRVRQELAELRKDETQVDRWNAIRDRVRDWIARLVTESVDLDVLDADFRLTRGQPRSSLSVPLRDAGDGVAQYTYLLAALALHPEEPALVFIDEPEAHLHPGATVELLRIIHDDLPHVQLVLATHSPSVVDAVAPDWRFWRVLRDASGASVAEPVRNQARRIAALDALGVSASQIFMARTVVWVEGPSDVVYYRALLTAVAPSLLAGRDYAFAIFGGSTGAHFAVDGDGTLDEVVVDVLQLAHRNVFVHDRDASKASRATVDRWKTQLGQAEVRGTAIPTPGLEVENLVSPSVLVQAATRTVDSITREGRRYDVCFRVPESLSPEAEFAESLARCAYDHGGHELEQSVREAIAEKLRRKKYLLAREVAAIAGSGGAEPVFTGAALEWAKGLADAIHSASGNSQVAPRPPGRRSS